jgi:hypothetical protein
MQRPSACWIGFVSFGLALSGCGSESGTPDAASRLVPKMAPSANPPNGNQTIPSQNTELVGPVAPAALGADSPQAVFDQATQAASRQDWRTWCACLSPQTQEFFVQGWIEQGSRWVHLINLGQAVGPAEHQRAQTLLQPLLNILARYGLDEESLYKLPDGSVREERTQALRQLAHRVPNHTTFLAEIMVAAREAGQPGPSVAWDPNARLTNVQINGDTATGMSIQAHQGRSFDLPIRFRQIGGQWTIDLAEELGFKP